MVFWFMGDGDLGYRRFNFLLLLLVLLMMDEGFCTIGWMDERIL